MKLTSQITEMVSAKITQGKCILWTILSIQLNVQLFVYNLFSFEINSSYSLQYFLLEILSNVRIRPGGIPERKLKKKNSWIYSKKPDLS